MLPISPAGPGNSPYSSDSSWAGNPLLVSLDLLYEEGLLRRMDLTPSRRFPAGKVSFKAVAAFRMSRLRKAFAAFQERGGRLRNAFGGFQRRQRWWLDDHALFCALRNAHGGKPWTSWDEALRDRRPEALRTARNRLAEEIAFHRFVQYVFDRQWAFLRKTARAAGVGLIGDLPLFVNHDSSDVWANQELFLLDRTGRPKAVSGVPPDAFSKSGQLWGHPLYNWRRHRASGFKWWINRLKSTCERFDAVRLDHFLGFIRAWAVPAGARTAATGRWLAAPGRELFEAVKKKHGRLRFIAEDLGPGTAAAFELRDRLGLPGMRILQFAFGSDDHHHHEPHCHPKRCVVYTGTHDSPTTVGWFRNLGSGRGGRGSARDAARRRRILQYLGSDGRQIHWDLIRSAMASTANLAIFPVQDILGLDDRARMNRPGISSGNWEWRLRPGELTGPLARRLGELSVHYGRASAGV